MGGAHTDCPNCEPGVYRCDDHKKPGRNKRKRIAREKSLNNPVKDLSQPVVDKDSVERRHNDLHQQKKNKHIIFEDDAETLLQAGDPSTVKRFSSSDIEVIVAATNEAIFNALVPFAGQLSAVAQSTSMQDVVSSATELKNPSISNDFDDSADSDESDDSDIESNSDESDYTYSDFGDESDDSALGTERPKDRLEAALSGCVLGPDVSTAERAQARSEALSKATHKEMPKKMKEEPQKKQKIPKTGNDRRLSKHQQKIISPNSFLPSCVSGIRDLIFELSSAPENAAGMTVKDMEGPIRKMMEREKFTVPETWNVIQTLRVILDQQTRHFHQLENDTGKWIVTKIPSRELSGRYLNELRAKRCSPTASPLEHPAMLHIFISRCSGTISTIQMERLDQSFESRIKTTNALFGAGKQQPETMPYARGTHAYPMHIKCALYNVQGTDLLQDMLALDPDCATALQELSTHAEQTFKDDPTFEGRFTYRVIISGLDGGSVNNDGWEGLQQTYPRLRGQLLIFDDRGVSAPDSPVVTQRPMMDWATPTCLLSKPQRKKSIHKHVVWGMFDMAMLAKEWTRDRASAPRIAGPRHHKIEHDQQLLACRKLLLSNSLLYYHMIDRCIATVYAMSGFTDPAFITNQTSCANVGEGRNDFVVDRCVPEVEPFARECRWCGSHEPIDTWARSDKPPQDDEPLLGFCCDRPECYVLEIEECRHAV
jgi:hypothetical protein